MKTKENDLFYGLETLDKFSGDISFSQMGILIQSPYYLAVIITLNFFGASDEIYFFFFCGEIEIIFL
jgi:hypothetical protein